MPAFGFYLAAMSLSLQSCSFYSCPTYSNSESQHARSKVVAKAYKKSLKKRGLK
jgi:hypothetical protein